MTKDDRVVRLRKVLDAKVFPKTKELIRRRDEAQEAYRKVQQLEGQYRAERGQLESELSRLRNERQAAMSRGADVTEIGARIREVEERLGAVNAWLPSTEPGRVGLSVAAVEEKRVAVERAQRELDSGMSVALRAEVLAPYQRDIDILISELETALSAYHDAVSQFTTAHGCYAISAGDLHIRATGKFARAII